MIPLRSQGRISSYDEASGWLIDVSGGFWTWTAPGTNISALPDDLSGSGKVTGGQQAVLSDADLSTIRSYLNQWRGIGVQHWL